MKREAPDQKFTPEDKPLSTDNPIKYSNIFRMNYTETDFTLDFGLVKPGEDIVNIVESITIPITAIQDLLLVIFNGAMQYEDTYDKDIGFKSIPRFNVDEK